jgi:hypothetical protein
LAKQKIENFYGENDFSDLTRIQGRAWIDLLGDEVRVRLHGVQQESRRWYADLKDVGVYRYSELRLWCERLTVVVLESKAWSWRVAVIVSEGIDYCLSKTETG